MHDHGPELVKGVIGMGSSVLAILTSLQEKVEHTLRCTSLLVGIAVGVLTAISIIKGWKKRS